MNTAVASFNTIMGQMAEMSQRKKQFHVKSINFYKRSMDIFMDFDETMVK